MKYTIEVEDFYLDEGENGKSLSESLQQYITDKVIGEIWKQIKEKVDDAITMKVKAKVEKELGLQINTRIAEIIARETITRDKKEILISDYIKDQFQANTGWNSPSEVIRQKAKEFGDEMKKRYDFLYANLIVTQMHNIGIIKEEIYANLIENKK